VLPIGGIREKTLAAQRAGLKRVILPRENEADLQELPPETREALEFVLVDSVEDVFRAVFDGKRANGRRRVTSVERQAASATPKLASRRKS
jgi:ATP-dependent Lon protease